MGLLVAISQFLALVLFAPIGILIALVDAALRSRRPHVPKNVLITGATSGIGEGLAKFYARPGVSLALTGRNEAALRSVADACRSAGATVHTHVGDVIDRDSLRAWIVSVDAACGGLDTIYANAGVTAATAGIDQAELESAARRLFAINVDGVWNTIFPALERMRARGAPGQIVLVSSLASYSGLTRTAAYCASKAAVRVYGEALRAELARERIGVTVVVPGFVKSPMTDVSQAISQPFKVDMDTAVGIIARGVADNDALVAFPSILYIASWMLSTLPAPVRDSIARNRWLGQIAYVRPSRSGGAAARTAAHSD